jgi:transcription-repair coupling factor (superfamily II helicase)
VGINSLKNRYKSSEAVKQIACHLQKKQSRIHLLGTAGSSDAFIADAVADQIGGNYLFVLSDKEEAAYFYNNLENITGKKRGTTLLFYPASYRRPYQIEEIDNANIIQRTEVLSLIRKKRKNIMVVTHPEAIIENVVSRKNLEKNTLEIEQGVEYSIDFINELLIEYEFEKLDHVYAPGQFSIRGGIVDIYSYSNSQPYRIEFDGDQVESIRLFEPSTQLSIKTVSKIHVVPNIQTKVMLENRESFLDYIPSDTKIWLKDYELSKGKIQKGFEKTNYIFEKLDSTIERLKPDELYLNDNLYEKQLNNFSIVEFGTKCHFEPTYKITLNIQPQPPFNKKFDLLISKLNENTENDYDNYIFSEQDSQLERLATIFKDIGKEVTFKSINLGIHEGFKDADLKVSCYTDHQIFERYHRFKLKKGYTKSQQAFTLKEIYNLKKGDYVVHIDHGVGQFSGLEKIDVNQKKQEAIRLSYKGGDILYISIHSLHRISKFTSKDGGTPSLNKLGSPAWNLAKQKTKKKIKEVAFDLIKLYAERKLNKGFQYSPDTYLQNELEASFIYEDTPDQLKATEDVKKDMQEEAPMDRLICGDVGFGKTEIAIRAAFKAVADNKQVAILVPTTILAFQHYKTFSERLKNFPCNVDYINRFKSSKKITETLGQLKDGKVDVIIGTHRLIGKDVAFKDLGLLIIDEEQKFGVSVKDKLKTIKTNVDTLTLTATPIPRTLQFSLMNARDLSIINTPPPNRFPVETIVQTFSEETIRDAVTYEVQRGGQAFIIHNRVQNIQEVAGMVQRLCPDIRVAVGHGQMEGKKLEAIILDFIEGLYDVLIATTIIESGIDIPNANTIIINNANNFGLSDLHQLRGRVGRSNKRAFAYLFTPPAHHLSDDARKRLKAIEQFSDLGSGFNISMRDLDIRGAGDLLGGSQSGFISEIGFETYKKILNEAIEELKENEFKTLFNSKTENKTFVKDCAIETDLELVIPDDYVNQIAERFNLYKELDEIKNETELISFEASIIDRFGPIPIETTELIKTIRLRWLAKEIGFERLILKSNILIGTFISNQQSAYYQSEQFSKVLNYVQNQKAGSKMTEKNNKLRLRFDEVKNIQQAIDKLRTLAN